MSVDITGLITNLSEAIGNHQLRLANINNNIQLLNDTIIENAKNQIAAAISKINELNEQIRLNANNQARISQLETQLATDKETYDKNIADLTAYKTQLETDLATKAQELQTANAATKTNQDEVTRLTEQLATLNTDLAAAKEASEKCTTDLNEITIQKNQLEIDKTALQTASTACNENIGKMQTAIQEATDELANPTQDNATNFENVINSLQDKITEFATFLNPPKPGAGPGVGPGTGPPAVPIPVATPPAPSAPAVVAPVVPLTPPVPAVAAPAPLVSAIDPNLVYMIDAMYKQISKAIQNPGNKSNLVLYDQIKNQLKNGDQNVFNIPSINNYLIKYLIEDGEINTSLKDKVDNIIIKTSNKNNSLNGKNLINMVNMYKNAQQQASLPPPTTGGYRYKSRSRPKSSNYTRSSLTKTSKISSLYGGRRRHRRATSTLKRRSRRHHQTRKRIRRNKKRSTTRRHRYRRSQPTQAHEYYRYNMYRQLM